MKFEYKITVNKILNILFFCLFFNAIHFKDIHLYIPSHFLFSVFTIIPFFYFNKVYLLNVIIFLGLVTFSIIYLLQYFILFDYFAYIIYLLPVLLLTSFASKDQFEDSLIHSIAFLVKMSILFYFLGFGHNYSYSFSRMQGFLSEPSALGYPISVFLLWGLCYTNKKKVFNILVGIFAIILSKSLIVYITTFFSLFLYNIFISSKKKAFLKVIILCLMIYYSIDILEFINSILNLSTLSRTIEGLRNIKTFGLVGYNPRFAGIMQFWEDVNVSKPILWFGRGLNSATPFYLNKGTLRYTYNLPSEIIFSLGLTGLFVYIFLLFLVLKFFGKTKKSKIIIYPLLVYTTINSAMGISFQIIFHIYIMYLVSFLFKKTLRYKNEKIS